MHSRTITLAAAGAAAAVIFTGAQAMAQSPPPAGVNSWAVVAARGNLVRASHATDAKRLSTGKYEVDFTSPVHLCAYTATVAGNAHLPAPAHIVVAHMKGAPNAVQVGTFDTVTLLPVDSRFMLNVSC